MGKCETHFAKPACAFGGRVAVTLLRGFIVQPQRMGPHAVIRLRGPLCFMQKGLLLVVRLLCVF